MLKIILFVFFVIYLPECYAKKNSIERKVTVQEVIPVSCQNITHEIIHVAATNTRHENDVIHYLFSCINRPTVVIKHVKSKSNVTINHNNICNQSGEAFQFYPDNSDVSGLFVSKVFPYADDPDLVSLEGISPDKIYDDIVNDFTWALDHPKSDKTEGRFVFHGKSKKYSLSSLVFSVDVKLKSGHSSGPPKNSIHANLTEFRFDMIQLPLNMSKHIRYAVEVTFFSSGKKSGGGHYSTIQYIDDEFTPGNFEIWSIIFPLIKEDKNLFMSWKPVSYIKEKRTRESQSLTKFFDEKGILKMSGHLVKLQRMPTWTIVTDAKDMDFFAMNMTFGLSKDGCYTNNPYLSWTGMVGYNKVPTDSMSPLVIIVIVVGVGTPGLFILVGIFVLVVRKVRFNKRNAYQQIN